MLFMGKSTISMAMFNNKLQRVMGFHQIYLDLADLHSRIIMISWGFAMFQENSLHLEMFH